MSCPRTGRLRRADLAAIAFLALAVALLTWSGFAGRLPSVRDMPGGTIPSRWFWRESILSGHLPLWNPYVSLGVPTIASPVHGSLYPLHLFLALLPFRAGFFATWALHALLGGAGGYALARACGCRPESALVAGLVWAVGGYATSMWWNGEKLLPTAWIPWIAWGVRAVTRAPRIFGRELALAAAFGALLCAAGDPFLLFDAALLGVSAALVATQGSPHVRLSRALAATCAVLGLTLLFAAPVLLPAALLRAETARGSALSLHDAELWSMHPVRWLELFVPRPLGDPLGDAQSYAGRVYADATSQVHPWAVSLFTGSATLALATAARGRRVLLPLGGAAVVALLLALGKHAPFDAWARGFVPGLALSRYPEKHAVVACGALALLASRGVEEIFARGREASLARVLGVAILGLVVAVVLAPEPLRGAVRQGSVHAAVVIAAIAGALLAARREPRLTWLVPVVAAADLVTSSRALLAWMPASALEPPAIARALATQPGEAPRRLLRLPAADFRRVESLPDDAATLFDVGAVPGWDPAVSPLIEPLSRALGSQSRARAERLLELLRIDAVLLPQDPDSPVTEWTAMRAPDRPRAWMVGMVALAQDDAEAFRDLAAPSFDPEAAAVLIAAETTVDVASLARSAPRALGACDLLDYRPAKVTLRCRPAAPALLVVADTAMRGWHATVDGAAAPILRTNVAVRGVALTPGTHDVEMQFEAPGLMEGFLVAMLGWLAVALAIVRGTRRSLRGSESSGNVAADAPATRLARFGARLRLQVPVARGALGRR